MTGPTDWSDRAYPTTHQTKEEKSGVMQAIDHSVAGSMIAQPPGIRPSALRVATHGQCGLIVGGGGLTSLQRCSRRILQPQQTGWLSRSNCYHIDYYMG